jgi:HEPN domain-containing protein
MININRQIEYWQKGSISDLETAYILVGNKKPVQGLFFCHLSIEKIIKALVAKTAQEIPPKSHDLFYLCSKAGIVIPDEQAAFMQILMKYQLEGRYPEYFPKPPPPEKTKEYLMKTKQLFEWFRNKL